MAHSIEIRRRAVDAYLKGAGSYEYVSNLLQVGSASLKRWVSKRRKTGKVEPASHAGGVEPIIGETRLEWLKAELEKKNDLTLGELCEHFLRSFRETVSSATM